MTRMKAAHHPAPAAGPANGRGRRASALSGLLIGLSALLADGGAQAESLTLEEAVLRALESNAALRSERLEPEIAATFQEIERAVFDPELFAELRVRREREDRLDDRRGDRFAVESEREDLGAGIRQQFAPGTEVELGITQDRRLSESDAPDARDGSALHRSRFHLTLNQPLLQGRGRDVNRVRIRQAELDTLRSEYELRGFAETLVTDVETSYWDLVQTEREIELFEASLALAEEQIERTRERVRLGDLPETELAPLQAEAALRRQELIDARNRRDVARLELLQLTGADYAPGEAPELTPETAPALPEGAEPDPVGHHLLLALEHRAELREARLLLERNELELVRTRNGLLPRLDLFVTLGKSGFADSFGSAMEELNGRSYDAVAGLRIEQPLGRRAGHAEHRQAGLQREQALLGIDNLTRLVQVDVQAAWLEVARSQAQIEATAATLSAQRERLRAEEARFEVGQTTAFALTQAQRDLLQAQVDHQAAQVGYRQALVDLYRLDGSLLERRGIQATGWR